MKNIIIKQLLTLSFLLSLGSSLIFAPPQPGALPPGMPQMSPQDMQAFDQELQRLLDDPKAMQEMAEFAEKLMAEDPEFKKLVEDMTVEMEEQFRKEGIDLNQLPQPTQPAETFEPLPIQQPQALKPTQPVVNKKTIKEIKRLLQIIAEKLAEIRQKAQDDKEFKKLFEPWQFNVDDVIYYAHALMEDSVVKYLAEKEFEPLYENLKLFAQALEQLEPKITPREFSLDQESPYAVLGIAPTSSYTQAEAAYRKKLHEHKAPAVIESQMNSEGRSKQEISQAKKQAAKERGAIEQAFNEIHTYEESKENLRKLLEYDVRTIVYTQNIKEQVKKLLATYDPEALKIQQATESNQTEARKKQDEAARRIPSYSPPSFYIPSYNQYPGAGRDYYPPYQDSYVPPSSTPKADEVVKLNEEAKKKGSSGGKKSPDKKPSDKDKKDSDDKKTRKPEDDAKVEVALATLETHLQMIVDSLDKTIDGTKTAKNLFENVTALTALLEKTTYAKAADEADIKAIQSRLTELTGKFRDAQKEFAKKINASGLTFAQKESIKKKAQELFAKVKKDSFDKIVPGLMKLNIDQITNDLKLDTTVIKLDEANKKYILRGLGDPTVLNTTTLALNPTPTDFFKDFIDSLTKLRTEMGITTSTVPVPPAAVPAAGPTPPAAGVPGGAPAI